MLDICKFSMNKSRKDLCLGRCGLRGVSWHQGTTT